MNCLIYARVSTKEQAEKDLSIPAQKEACLKYIQDKGWNFIDCYIDHGESARSANRPQLQEMLSRIKKDSSINAVIVHKLDRLARNLSDHVAIKSVLQRNNIQLVSVIENIEDSASGKLIENILASLAEFYSANLSTEVKKGLLQKVKQGGWNGQAPVGYKNIRETIDGKSIAKIVPDPDMAPLVKEAFNLYATGQYSITELYSKIVKKGLKSRQSKEVISRSKFARNFRNKAYIGIITYQGIEYQGIHKPLISKNLFDRVQNALTSHNRSGERKRKHTHYLRGTVWCGYCGARLSSSIAKGKYLYFYCIGKKTNKSCPQIHIPIEKIENKIQNLYKDIELPKEFIIDLTIALEKDFRKSEASNFLQREFMIKRLNRLSREREKVLQAFYAEAITLELLKKEQQRITESINQLETELSKASISLDQIKRMVEVAIKMASNCHLAYQKAAPKAKRLLNQAFFEKICFKGSKVSDYKYTELFEFLYNFNKVKKLRSSDKDRLAEREGFEPSKELLAP